MYKEAVCTCARRGKTCLLLMGIQKDSAEVETFTCCPEVTPFWLQLLFKEADVLVSGLFYVFL